MAIDHAKVRREGLRWLILSVLDRGRPVGAPEEMIFDIARDMYSDTSQMEVRRELDYLEDRGLVEIERKPIGRWHAALTHQGVDCVEYASECGPGIARPPKYWVS
ncbi:hypothetical protein [Lysobacter sp. CA196]|uniref:hypothetical protein n=1 Tax=Lysobacter sp. CA196 TaxID=3455606 RepID=UPI003F8D7E1B